LFKAIESKVLGILKNRNAEVGQTSSEYVAVTAVAVAIAIGVIYSVLSGALSTAVSDIGAAITSFVSSAL